MARPLSLSLFAEEPVPRRTPAPASPPRVATKQLWLAVYFPRLALEVHRLNPGTHSPIAVVDGHGHKTVVHDCTRGAADAGIRTRQLLSAAIALLGTLHTVERNAAAERSALLRLASIGHNFTPTVSLEDGCLLLEVEGSAHLFGGPVEVRARARDMFGQHGFTSALALAPTPIAALWLAQAGIETSVTSIQEIRSVLGRLPVDAMDWSAVALDAFHRLGIEHMGDVLRLPRDGLAKRFGKDFVAMLDRALGHLPDPRAGWNAPKRCAFSREMPGELIQMDHLTPYIDDMVDDLARELRAHDAAVDRIKMVFKHWQQPPTIVMVGSAIPYRQPDRWRELVHHRLSCMTLPAPVLDIRLLSGRLMPYTALNLDLLGGKESNHDSLQRLVDLLRARLGRRAVFGMTLSADARPEKAFRRVEPGAKDVPCTAAPSRPIHVLSAPIELTCSGENPRYRGATLKFLDGPERIEGGWWSKETWIRDYYQALSTRGERLWVFREGKHWYLHGLFS